MKNTIIIALALLLCVMWSLEAAPKATQVEDAEWCVIIADLAESIQTDRIRHQVTLHEYLTAIDEEVEEEDNLLRFLKSISVTVFNHHRITVPPTDVWAVEFGSCMNKRIRGEVEEAY